jgi:ubiquinone/menaquinone biosynthesis C-methylase UbiE
MDIRSHNRAAWEALGNRDCPWTRPVTTADIAAARQGDWQIYLTPTTPIPRTWLAPVENRTVLCLASGGGQQGPILAAVGASVTVLDFSEQQLARDRAVAERDGLRLETVQADMTDLSLFADQSFDLVIHPVANVYIPDIQPVWREAARVLRSGGRLLAGFMNPMLYIFDQDRLATNEYVVRHRLPYSELTSISTEERQQLIDSGDALQFSHTLAAQLAGQLAVGLYITGFYEDRRTGHPLAPYMPTHFATCAVKP